MEFSSGDDDDDYDGKKEEEQQQESAPPCNEDGDQGETGPRERELPLQISGRENGRGELLEQQQQGNCDEPIVVDDGDVTVVQSDLQPLEAVQLDNGQPVQAVGATAAKSPFSYSVAASRQLKP